MNNLKLFPFPLKFSSKSVKLLSFDKFFFLNCARVLQFENKKRVKSKEVCNRGATCNGS